MVPCYISLLSILPFQNACERQPTDDHNYIYTYYRMCDIDTIAADIYVTIYTFFVFFPSIGMAGLHAGELERR